MATPKQAERFERVLQASLAEFCRAGYADGSVDRIARASGVAKTTIYRHFSHKEGLFKAVFHLALDRLAKLVLNRREGTTFEENLRLSIESLLRDVSRNPATLLIFQTVGPDSGIPDSALRLELTEAYMTRAMGAIDAVRTAQKLGQVRQDLDPEGLHMAMIGLVHSLIHHWLWKGRSYDLARNASLIGDILFQGIKPPRSSRIRPGKGPDEPRSPWTPKPRARSRPRATPPGKPR